MNIIESLNWRYSVKKMSGKKIPDSKLNLILESIRLCPTSLGLQPFNIIIIENLKIKQKILPIAYNQKQIIQCSHLIIFAFWENNYEKEVDNYINNIKNIRKVSIESLDKLKNSILFFLKSKNNKEKKIWAKHQTYIALGMALTTCALEKIDSTPIEGFNIQKLNKLLKLDKMNLSSSVLLAIGYRDKKNDDLAYAKKVRRNKDDFFINL